LKESQGAAKKSLPALACTRKQNEAANRFLHLTAQPSHPALWSPLFLATQKAHLPVPRHQNRGISKTQATALDEIGELPLELQAKLLRVLENGEYQRVGETQKHTSQARIIAATNRDLRKEIRSGNFRADLYHRLSVFSISVPPLREMEDDKLLLLEHFRQRYAEQTQQAPFSLSDDARALWLRYTFPGNVRELRNVVIRLIAKHPGQIVSAATLEPEFDLQDEPAAPAIQQQSTAQDNDGIVDSAIRRLQLLEPFNLDQMLRETERGYIDAALKLAHGNVSQAARLLGINRTTLYNRMESFVKEQ
jgi:two-component system nitrogen regulation response regulator GlnG